jgi:hypothetical protein
VGEGTGQAGEHPHGQRARRGGGRTWSVAPFTTGLGPSNRTTEPGCEPLSLVSGIP